MKDLIRVLAQHLVDNPDSVLVKEYLTDRTLILELKVEKADVGKVIGREGRTAQAMRTILNAVSRKLNKRAVLEILD